MRYGFVFPGGDAGGRACAGVEAEATGWDGFFMWEPVRAWTLVMLAVAARTQRIRLYDADAGVAATPLAGERTATLDAPGAVISPWTGRRKRGFATRRGDGAQDLPNCWTRADIIPGCGRASPSTTRALPRDAFSPPPLLVQQPLSHLGGCVAARSRCSALRYDGLLPNIMDPEGLHDRATPQQVAAMKAYRRAAHQIRRLTLWWRRTPGDDPEAAQAQSDRWPAATWWIEAIWDAGPGCGAGAVATRPASCRSDG